MQRDHPEKNRLGCVMFMNTVQKKKQKTPPLNSHGTFFLFRRSFILRRWVKMMLRSRGNWGHGLNFYFAFSFSQHAREGDKTRFARATYFLFCFEVPLGVPNGTPGTLMPKPWPQYATPFLPQPQEPPPPPPPPTPSPNATKNPKKKKSFSTSQPSLSPSLCSLSFPSFYVQGNDET